MSDVKSRLKEFHKRISEDLQKTVDFWIKHSHDEEFGGFFNCLGRDGKLYDETKYTWLQGRQVYMYASLLRRAPDVITDKERVLQAAERAAEFLIKNAKDPATCRCCFSTTRDGRPIKVQRSIFSESFYTMAMLELYEVTKKDIYQTEGLAMLDKIVYWTQEDDKDLGFTKLAGYTATKTLAVPMILLSLGQLPLPAAKKDAFKAVEEKCVKEILRHQQRNDSVILENITPEGNEIPGCQGRSMNPGHAIECGWFLLDYANKTENTELQKIAIDKFIVIPFKGGWDEKYNGIFYFLDVDNFCPTQLEWDMKLWWPHNEALIALLMAWKTTKDDQYLSMFQQVYDYSYEHFVDEENGEWYGYLNRRGEITHNFKGSPWKGCFHVPRCLLMCRQMLADIISK